MLSLAVAGMAILITVPLKLRDFTVVHQALSQKLEQATTESTFSGWL